MHLMILAVDFLLLDNCPVDPLILPWYAFLQEELELMEKNSSGKSGKEIAIFHGQKKCLCWNRQARSCNFLLFISVMCIVS